MIIQASRCILNIFVFVLFCARVVFVLKFITEEGHLFISIKCKSSFRDCFGGVLFSVHSQAYHFLKVTQMIAVLDRENIFNLRLTKLAQPTVETGVPFMNFPSTLTHNSLTVIVVRTPHFFN